MALVSIGLIGSGLVKVAAIYQSAAKQPDGRAEVPVQVVIARRGAVADSVSTIGTVQALNTVVIRARVDGAIEQVLFKEGQVVAKGDLLIKLDPLPFEAQLRVAQAQRAKDAALLENAKIDLGRYESLLQADSTSTQTRDTARSQVAQLSAAVANDAAQVDLARLSLSYTTINAPITGRVGARLVDAGNIVHVADSTALVVITQLRPIAISFAIPQDRLAELRAAQRAGPVSVTVVDGREGKPPSDGELILIDNQIDATTATIRCKAQFPNANDEFWPGQFVDLKVGLRILADAVMVPAAAVQTGTDGAYVYVLAPGNVAKIRNVKVASIQGDDVIITSGVSAGDSVVTEGQFRLEPDAVVRIEPPGRSPALKP